MKNELGLRMLGYYRVRVWLENSLASKKVGDRVGAGQSTETGCGE